MQITHHSTAVETPRVLISAVFTLKYVFLLVFANSFPELLFKKLYKSEEWIEASGLPAGRPLLKKKHEEMITEKEEMITGLANSARGVSEISFNFTFGEKEEENKNRAIRDCCALCWTCSRLLLPPCYYARLLPLYNITTAATLL